MKCEIPPIEVSDLVPFTPPPNSCESQSVFAGVSKNGLWMWIVQDTTISLYHTENSEWFGGYCFAKSLKKPSVKIIAVTEFCSSHISFPCLLISVNEDDKSIVCMYDINKSKVVRAVLVPDKVTSLEVISGNGGACMETHYLFIQLRYMFGVVAVGTADGHIYFLDLGLDEDFFCNESLPNITVVLKKYELHPEHREKAISKHQHILMVLNDQSVRNGSFEFESRSSSLGHFPYGKVRVTALKYILNSVTLAVGFNFGGIQLWGLQDLCLLYTVSNQPQEQPIIAFAFQEPENDPRHFCYLWIIRGHSANEKPEDFSVATMHALVYDKRTYMESFGYLYTDLRNCFKRFEYRMTSDPFSAAQSSSSAGSCLLSCQTVCQTEESNCFDVCSLNDSDTASESMSLCFLSWIVWSHSENTPTSYHLALFDLNQWYRAEMPSSNFRSEPSDLNPYFAHFSLEEVAQIFDLEPLLGLYAIPHSIKKFKYNTPSEEFFFPSALDYQTVVFSSIGTCKTTFMGLQKRLLYQLSDIGPNILVNPKEIYSNFIRSGLVSDPHTSSDRVPLIVQRETLMQLALEYHMPPFFIKCLKEWRYADSIQEGCTSRALLNWAWKKIIQIKSSIDKLTIPLFNCSDTNIDKGPLKCLYSYRRQLDLIDTILMGYQKFAAPRTEQGIQELQCRKNVVFSINTYLQVMLWLRSVRVLPEVCEGDETERNMLYPVNALLNSYLKRRSHLKKIHSSIGPTDILLIDGLIKEAFNENTWQEKGGNGLYPPPSIYAALSCYLMDDVPLELKHSLMYYVLLDICDAPHNKKSPMVPKVKKFPSIFGMSQSVSKLVIAFWYLDQFNFEVAIKKLLEPGIKTSDILSWQHHRVVKSFLFQGEAQKALKYINHMEPPEITIEDMKLHLSVLLARGSIIQAFDYQRSKQSIGCGVELLNHLFLGCQETHKLKDLIYMPLNSFESSALVKFLSENEDPHAQETLVIYYLLRCNYFEAAKINEKLSMASLGRSAASRERVAGRDALVEGLLNSVPKMEKNLVYEINRFPSVPFQKVEVLKPLSLSVKSVPIKQITYSDILNSLLTEASSAMCAPYLEPQTPLKSVNRSNYENLPFLRPPLTPERTKIPTDNIHSTPVTKRTLTSPSSEFSSPSKRSRLLDSAPFRTPLSKRKLPKYLAGDVASLLQSPPIPRRSSKQSKSTPAKDSPASAPQGILKKKTEPTKFPSDFFTSKTPSVLSDADDDSDAEECDDNEMNVDAAPDDIPGRQIRFSVPSKEDLNTSTYSNISVESTVSSVSHESSNFLKKLKELKSLSSLEPVDLNSREFMNVTQRKNLLTREPLKSHLRISPEKTLDLNEHNQISHKNLLTGENTPLSSKDSFQHKNSEPVTTLNPTEASDSDSCSALEDENKKDYHKITHVQPSSVMYSSSFAATKMVERNLLSSATNAESPLNRSGSSSGNSSYNSASERSFIITPRRPLRDNNKDTSIPSTSTLYAQEDEKRDEINLSLPGEEIAEEMIIDDNDDNETNTNHHSSDEEEISIIGEVPVPPPFEKKLESDSQPRQEECICVDIPDLETVASSSKERTYNQDFMPVLEEKVCDSANKPFLSNEESLDIEQVFDSHEENNSNKVNDNQEAINNFEEYHGFQDDNYYNADRFSNNYNQISYMEQLNIDQNQISNQFNVNQFVSDNVADDIKESDNIQSGSTEQCSDIQNQIMNTNSCSNQNQVTVIEQVSSNQNQVTNAEYVSDNWSHVSAKTDRQTDDTKSDIEIVDAEIDVEASDKKTDMQTDNTKIDMQIDNTKVDMQTDNVKIDIPTDNIQIDMQIDNTKTDIQTENTKTDMETDSTSTDMQTDNTKTDVQTDSAKTNIQTDDTKINIQIDPTKTDILIGGRKIDVQTGGTKNDMQTADTKTDMKTAENMKVNVNTKTFVGEIKEHQLYIDNIDEQIIESLDCVVDTVQEEIIEKAGIECVIKVCTDSTEVQVDESTESCSSEIFNFAKDAPVSEYVPIKERINRFQQSSSRTSRFEDDDQTYPSLLLQEHVESKKQDELYKNKKLVIPEHPSSSESKKIETVTKSSQDMDIDFHVDSTDLKPASSTSTNPSKNISQRLTERFDFLSKNSEFYENNKLYRETMTLLKSDMPLNFGFDVEKKSSRKTRNFVFKKEEDKAETKTDSKLETKTEAKSVALEGKTDTEAGSSDKFCESWHPETYEQFSSSIQKGRSDAGQKEILKSSPNTDLQKSSISIFEKANESVQSSSRVKGRRKHESTSKDSSIDKKELTSIKKAKGKGKAKKKMEFSFAEPHSPAGPEILEALTTPSQYPVGSFMFSPPLTRGKLRQKRMDDTLGSSFASIASEASFAKEKRPPVDSILQGIMDEKAPETQKLKTPASKRKTKTSPKKKTIPKKSEKTNVSQPDILDSSIDTSRMIEIDSPAISKVLLSSRQAPKHRMVLRQTKTKSRTEQLF